MGQRRRNSGEIEPARLLILGLGNPMMADDGIGHAVLQSLEHCELPSGIRVRAIDGDVLELTQIWKGEPEVWLVDAVSGGSPAGTLRIFEHQELLDLPADGLSTHHLSLSESLRWLLHGRPDMAAIRFRLYGIEVGVVRPERGLSRAAEDAVFRLAGGIQTAVRDMIASLPHAHVAASGGGDESTFS